MSAATMPPASLDTTGVKRRVAAVRRKSSVVTEEGVQERLGLRRQASTVRKAAILESLGKWDTDEDLIFKKTQGGPRNKNHVRRKSFDDGPLINENEEMAVVNTNRAKSAEPARRSPATSSHLAPKQKSPKKEVGSTSSPVSPMRASTPCPRGPATAAAVAPKRASAPPKDSSSRSFHERSAKKLSPRRSSRRVKKASSRSIMKDQVNPTNLDEMFEDTDDTSTKKSRTSGSTKSNSGSVAGGSVANGGSSVVSAPSKLPNNRAKRRTSKGPKSARSMANGAGKPRRTKSSDLEQLAETTKKKSSKRRSKSADHDVDFGPDILVEVKSEKSKKKGRTKRRSSQKRASGASQPATVDGAENDTVANPQAQQPQQDRRASLVGTAKKRAHSAGPLKRNKTEDVEKPALPTRAASMMLNRDNTRRGKANSLMDLVQYTADEIHSTSYFASNHVLVNRERMKRGLRPLTRNIAMDTLARESAEAMAKSAGTSPLRTTYVGNVLRGESIRAVHRAIMLNKAGRERQNILNPYFQDFGVGTSKGNDNMLYVCQLFSERLELSCTDLAPADDEE